MLWQRAICIRLLLTAYVKRYQVLIVTLVRGGQSHSEIAEVRKLEGRITIERDLKLELNNILGQPRKFGKR